jgi:hypothetical protein
VPAGAGCIPAFAARLTVQRSLEPPHGRVQELPEGAQRDQGDAVGAVALGLQQIEAAIDGFTGLRDLSPFDCNLLGTVYDPAAKTRAIVSFTAH